MRSRSRGPIQGPVLISRTERLSVVSTRVWPMPGDYSVAEQSESLHSADARASGTSLRSRVTGAEKLIRGDQFHEARVGFVALGQKTPGVTTKDSSGDLT